jgi:hypothetical protein
MCAVTDGSGLTILGWLPGGQKEGPRGPTPELRTCRLFLFDWCTPANSCEQLLILILALYLLS